jgi:hypothetical protein
VDPDKQWRIDTGLFLKGATLQRLRWKAQSGDCDHDPCACCWAKFAKFDGPDIQHEGYTTADRYHWVCEGCVTDLRDEMDWHLAPTGESGI